jgi:hypothetical protein
MPLIQGGPPEWIWERTPEKLKWGVVTSERPDGPTVYELRVQCGLEIMRLQFFTAEEVRHLASLLAAQGAVANGTSLRRWVRERRSADGRPRRNDPRLKPFRFGQSLALGEELPYHGSGFRQPPVSPLTGQAGAAEAW